MNTIDRPDPLFQVQIARGHAQPVWPWRAWFGRQWRRLAAPSFRPVNTDFDALAELDARTLADIGAPDRLLARAMSRRELHRQEREGLRFGLASGAWQHW